MQFGVCGGPDIAEIASRASYDFGEWTVEAVLKPREPEEVFKEALAGVKNAALPYPVLNIFIPGDLKITGPEVDTGALREYVSVTFARAEQAGVEIIVFGSGGARGIPEGFDLGLAHEQLVSFSAMAGEIASGNRVTIALEHLNKGECNVLNAIGECAALVREVDHPSFQLLIDDYHLMREDDSYEEIAANVDILAHVHLATKENRLPPGAEECDFNPFFDALAGAGYDGRVSIEATMKNPEEELPEAISVMKNLLG